MDINTITKKTTPTLKSYGVKKAALFGSQASGDAKQASDVDILVELGTPMSLLEYIGLKQDLEDSLGQKVDLVQYKSIKPSLKDSVLREATTIYKA